MHKLIVVSMDALIQEDLEYLSQKPAFGWLLSHCAQVDRVKSIYPTLTYPCHATMATGCLPAKHGVINNNHFIPGKVSPPWLWYHDVYKAKDLLDACKEKGLTTACVGWPSMGKHPHADYLVGEIAATKAKTDEEFRADYLATGTTPELWDAACAPHIYLRTQEKCVAAFNAAACCQIIRRFAPDLVLLHTGEPDHSRHQHGVYASQNQPALDLCEQILSDLLAAIQASGSADVYNLVVTADHGHLDTTQASYPNVLFAQQGLLQLDDKGNVTDWKAWSLSTGMCAEVFVKEAKDEPEVYELLRQCQYGWERVYTRQESAREGFDGPFSFVLETDGRTRFENNWTGDILVPHGSIKGSHGFHPDKGPRPPLLATGPAFREKVTIADAHLTDGAPTWAAVLGVELPDADGTVLQALLK